MPVLTVESVSKSFGERILLDEISFAIDLRERVGLVGINGSGKSSLARIVAGVDMPDMGKVPVRRGSRIVYLDQDPKFPKAATVRHTVETGLGAWAKAKQRHEALSAQLVHEPESFEQLLELQQEAAAEIDRLGGWDLGARVDAFLSSLRLSHRADAQVGEMSGGERRRVALAQALVGDPELIVLDEPTNHLDMESIEWLERYLVEEFRGALLLVTHDRYLLDRVVGRTLEIDRGAIQSFVGGWEEYLSAKAERLSQEARMEANRQNFLRRELEWLRRQPKARTGKQKARTKRAESAQQRNLNPQRQQMQSLVVESPRLGKTVLDLEELGVEIEGGTLVEGFSYSMQKGERIGIVGPNGCGKTTLLNTLLGKRAVHSGKVRVGKNTRFAYLDQQRSGLDLDRSISQNVAEDDGYVLVGTRSVEIHSYLERFLFRGDQIAQKVGSLSGGERARVALAKMLLEEANVIVLDEPTNDLDVATLGAVEELLLEMQGTALVVTHDRYFLDRIATGIWVFEGDGRLTSQVGTYSDWKARQADQERSKKKTRVRDSEKSTVRSRKPERTLQKKLSWKEERELEGLLERVDEAEEKVRLLEARLADPALYANGGEVASVVEELERAKEEVEQLTARWEELELRKSLV
ncbi:MAG: ABC-F family ATP-binding cassette domain-containing protein [Myxococcota bacterium]